ncbi:MAG: hypothetical protein NVS9B11_22950 [Candidatus Dormibacteraceae bacterium]
MLNAGAGLVETVFSVTGNLDRQGDVIVPGAFKNAAKSSPTPAVVFSHVWDDVTPVLGKTTAWSEVLPGDPTLPARLKALNAKAGEDGPQFGCVKAQVKFDLETPAGQVAFTHVKNENLKEWSFAFDIDEGGAYYEDQGKSESGAYAAPVRFIKSIKELFEVSLVLIGANPATSTVGWKSFRPESTKAIEEIFDAYQAFAEAPPEAVGDFDYRAAAEAALGEVVLGPKDTPPAAIEVQPEAIDDSIPMWMQVGIMQALSPATDTVPDNTASPDVADLDALTSLMTGRRFEIDLTH